MRTAGLAFVLLVAVGGCQKSKGTVLAPRVGNAAPPETNAVEPAPSPVPEDPPSPPAPEPKLAEEIAWAKKTYPDALAKVAFESLAANLVAWVPADGEVAAYLSSDRHACEKTVLVHVAGAEALAGRILTQESAKERSWTAASFGHHFETESAGGTDERQNGKWVNQSVHAIGDAPDFHGTLTRVDDEVAVFGGIDAGVYVGCGGPHRTWKCPSGGERTCDACTSNQVEIEERIPSGQRGRIEVKTSGTCKDDCPVLVPPDRNRLESLFGRATPFMPKNDASAPRLYRSKQRCMSERKGRKKKP